MNEKKVLWKIIVGAVVVLISAGNLPLYMNGSTQSNTGLALSALMMFGGFYLIYRGLVPGRS